MKAEHINPFLKSLVNTFKTMLYIDLTREPLFLKEGNHLAHPISGVVTLSGQLAGTAVISVSEEVALQAASTMLMMDVPEVNDDVIDTVGEMANLFVGGAKADLAKHKLTLGLPKVVNGTDQTVDYPAGVTPLCVPFQCEWGPMQIEVALAQQS